MAPKKVSQSNHIYFVQARNSLNLIIHHCIAAPYDPTVSSTPSKDEPLYKEVENAEDGKRYVKVGMVRVSTTHTILPT